MRNKRENMNIEKIKKAMLQMSQTELTQIVMFASQLNKISNGTTSGFKDTFSVGMSVNVVQKTKSTPAVILKMNPKKAQVEMNWQGRGLSKVNVPYSMLEVA
jgi:hypothetical protein|tara:strand:- start:662 stop:967 length:306 start_codon:yes stop_codon:yes gene_type:complete